MLFVLCHASDVASSLVIKKTNICRLFEWSPAQKLNERHQVNVSTNTTIICYISYMTVFSRIS